MLQVLFRIPIKTDYTPDGIPIYGFGMMLFLAFLLCTWVAGRRAERAGIRKEVIQDLAIWIFVGGLLGARICYLAQDDQVNSVSEFFKRLPRIWDGGIILYGSFAGGLAAYGLAYWFIYKKQGLSTRKFVDVVAPTICLGLCLGRLGCFLNGCCFGQVACAECAVVPVSFPLSAPVRDVLVAQGLQTAAGFTVMPSPLGHSRGVVVEQVDPGSAAYKAGLRPNSVLLKVNDTEVNDPRDVSNILSSNDWPRGQASLTLTYLPDPKSESETVTIVPWTLGLYPTQLYEFVSMLMLFLVLIAYDPLRRQPGQIMAVLMVGYGLHRFLNEILRDDPRPVGFESYTSILLVIAGALWWIYLQVKPIDPADSTTAEPAKAPA